MLTIKKIILEEPVRNEENFCSLEVKPLHKYIPKLKKTPEKPKPNQTNQQTKKPPHHYLRLPKN